MAPAQVGPAVSVDSFPFNDSTYIGSIIAAALGIAKLPVGECIDIFKSTVRDVFSKDEGYLAFWKTLSGVYEKGAQYSHAALHCALQNVFGDMPLRGMGSMTSPELVRVGITTTDLLGQLVLFCSYADVEIEGLGQLGLQSAYPHAVRDMSVTKPPSLFSY